MAYDEALAGRLREALREHAPVDERKMFGGLTFMIAGHMCCGVVNSEMVVRLGPDEAARALVEPHTRPMDFTGRPMAGFIYVSAEGVADDAALMGLGSPGR
ncbi:MAG TPA: TfoX/Sxy family protein [Chloroflexota bacterium]|jgi:TfoX/Sxy family transcriptional regulator of competence genes